MQLVKRAFLAFVVVFPLIWFFVLHSYQKMRILVLFNPDVDPYGSGYHVIQSKISIGSGGFIGQGLFEGTQSQLNFLPENHTDFIFSVIGEELGFVGAIFVLFLFFVLLYRTYDFPLFGGCLRQPARLWDLFHVALPDLHQCRHDPRHYACHRHPAAFHELRRLGSPHESSLRRAFDEYLFKKKEIDV